MISFLPIVGRELRVAARRRNTYWGRVVSTVVAALIAGWIILNMSYSFMARSQLGLILFRSLSGFVFVYCLLAGLRATADCLAEEKREGTLGLLFLTDLKGYDIVFGKLTASSLTTFYNLLAVFPVMAIAVLLGGVTGDMLARTSVLMLNTMLFSLAIGMLASALSRDGRRAFGLAFLLELFFVGGLPLLGVWWNAEFSRGNGDVPMGFLIASPAYTFSAIENRLAPFWQSLAVTHGLAWMALLAASGRLPRSWQDKASAPAVAALEQRAATLAFGDSRQKHGFRAELLNRNPVLWLAARNRMDSLLLWGFLTGSALVWFCCAWRWPKDWFSEPVYFMTAIALHLIVKAWLAGQACRQFAEDRRTGALELLLATTLSVKEIVYGQLLALRRLFGGPIAVLLAVDSIFAFACVSRFGLRGMEPYQTREAIVMAWTFAGGMATLLADAYAIAWLGMWFGLTSRNAGQASSNVIWRVILLPSVVAWIFFGVIGLGAVFRRWNPEPETMMVLWFAIGFVNDFIWVKFARNRLLTGLREAATRRFEAGSSNWIAQFFGRKQPPVLAMKVN